MCISQEAWPLLISLPYFLMFTLMAKPMKTLALHYRMIQLLIKIYLLNTGHCWKFSFWQVWLTAQISDWWVRQSWFVYWTPQERGVSWWTEPLVADKEWDWSPWCTGTDPQYHTRELSEGLQESGGRRGGGVGCFLDSLNFHVFALVPY